MIGDDVSSRLACRVRNTVNMHRVDVWDKAAQTLNEPSASCDTLTVMTPRMMGS